MTAAKKTARKARKKKAAKKVGKKASAKTAPAKKRAGGKSRKKSAKPGARKRSTAREPKRGAQALLDRLTPRDLPALDELLPVDELQRIGEVGLFGFLSEYVQERAQREPALRRDPAFLEENLPLLDTVLRYFDAEVEGFENLPERGPMLLVGNHSGGTVVPDTSVLIASWYRERGLESPLVLLAFDALLGLPGIGEAARKGGVVPASHANASRALAEGAAVLTYPGGDHEAYRPWTARNRIDFGGRKGFVKLALREQVPVVPVVGHGGHESLLVIARGDSMSGAVGFDRLRTTVMPLVWQLPWGLSIPFTPGIPMPVKITMQLGAPMDWSRYGPEDADDPAVVDLCYYETISVMQEILDRLAKEHPHPLAERLRSLLPGGGG